MNYNKVRAFYYELKNCDSIETFTRMISRGCGGLSSIYHRQETTPRKKYTLLFNWMQDKKIRNINHFWVLVALIKDDNNTETFKKK